MERTETDKGEKGDKETSLYTGNIWFLIEFIIIK